MFYVPYTTANPTTYLFLEKSNPSRHQKSANALDTIHKHQNFVSGSRLRDKMKKWPKTVLYLSTGHHGEPCNLFVFMEREPKWVPVELKCTGHDSQK